MAIETPAPRWRNFAAWSAAAGVMMVAIVAVTSWLGKGDATDALLSATTDPRVALILLLAMSVVGLSSLNKPFGWRGLRNFAVLNAVAVTVAFLALTFFLPLVETGTFGTMGASHWTAAGVGLLLLFFAGMISLMPAAASGGWTTLDPDQVETLRERRPLLRPSWISIAAMGLMLILLGLAGPGSRLSPTAVLAGLLVLAVIVSALSIRMWRMMDELDRTLSYETGNIAFYLILLLGGTWSILAHLGFVAPPAPLDWVTMLTVLMFVASFVAAGRRKLFTR